MTSISSNYISMIQYGRNMLDKITIVIECCLHEVENKPIYTVKGILRHSLRPSINLIYLIININNS